MQRRAGNTQNKNGCTHSHAAYVLLAAHVTCNTTQHKQNHSLRYPPGCNYVTLFATERHNIYCTVELVLQYNIVFLGFAGFPIGETDAASGVFGSVQ